MVKVFSFIKKLINFKLIYLNDYNILDNFYELNIIIVRTHILKNMITIKNMYSQKIKKNSANDNVHLILKFKI